MSQLTPKQQQFCREYLVDLNATQAAIRAGYSKHAARSIALECLTKPHIQAHVQGLMAERSKRTEITSDRVLIELGRIGFADARKFVDANGRPIPLHKLDDNTAAAIAGLDLETKTERGKDGKIVSRTRLAKIRLVPKNPAIEMIGRHLGMFADARDKMPEDRGTVPLTVALNFVYQQILLRERGGSDVGAIDTTAAESRD